MEVKRLRLAVVHVIVRRLPIRRRCDEDVRRAEATLAFDPVDGARKARSMAC
jgi:hypothetical protein